MINYLMLFCTLKFLSTKEAIKYPITVITDKITEKLYCGIETTKFCAHCLLLGNSS